ncbi:MAG: antitoxin VbhA family protein [Nitrospira sp.]|nr:antitoxin VbhA family protein [Nitrospira sp.]
MLTEAEIERNLRAVTHAIAQQELEGLTVPPETVEDMRKIARGEMSNDDLIRKLYSRFPNVPIFTPR